MTHGGTRPARRLDPLVGRTGELESFRQLLDELDHGAAIAVELLGEPGIGKTRLLSELARLAELRGQLVLSGSASELERELPFSVFVHALDEYVETLDPAVLAGLDDDVQAELAHVLPSLSALADGRSVAHQHERYRSDPHRAGRLRPCEVAHLRMLLEDRPPARDVLLYAADVDVIRARHRRVLSHSRWRADLQVRHTDDFFAQLDSGYRSSNSRVDVGINTPEESS